MIVFKIRCNFFIVLSIRLEICRSKAKSPRPKNRPRLRDFARPSAPDQHRLRNLSRLAQEIATVFVRVLKNTSRSSFESGFLIFTAALFIKRVFYSDIYSVILFRSLEHIFAKISLNDCFLINVISWLRLRGINLSKFWLVSCISDSFKVSSVRAVNTCALNICYKWYANWRR